MMFSYEETEKLKKMYLNKILVLFETDEQHVSKKISDHSIVAILSSKGIATILAKNANETLYKKIPCTKQLLKKGTGQILTNSPTYITYKIVDRHGNVVLDSAEQTISITDFL